jgi:dihydrofolate reductase
MRCSAFIATSVDGYIATKSGDVDWLETAGKSSADMGFNSYIASVDCIIMGRKTMEKLSSFNLAPEHWPYGDIPIFVLSNTCKEAPDNLNEKVEMYSGEISQLIARIKNEGYQHAYIDGGATITSFINLQFLDDMTITYVPILLGGGVSLFGEIHNHIKLEKTQADVFPNDCVQIKYEVNYL